MRSGSDGQASGRFQRVMIPFEWVFDEGDRMAQQVVFYSWQSWTDAGANRNFIEDCLERSIKEIRKDDSLRLDPVIDRDVQGVPGAADIANTIFGKINEADVFVADVSFVSDAAVGRRVSNPNVLVELGYALGKLGEGKVICVHNLATGQVEDLPFDIRGRTVATYELPPKLNASDEGTWQALRAEQRKQLVGKLKHAITAILSATDPAITEFVNQMVEQLILTIIFGGEVEDRPIKPGCEVMRSVLESVAGKLRTMACQEQAARLNLGQRLDEVACAIEDAIHFTRYLGRDNHDEYVRLVTRSVELATALNREWADERSLNRDNLTAIHRRLYEMRRQLDNLVSRVPTQFRRPGGLDEAYETANLLGLDLCRFGQFNLDPIQSGLATRLSGIGRNLHLVGVTLDYAGGMSRGPQKAAENLERFANEFGTLVDSLPVPR